MYKDFWLPLLREPLPVVSTVAPRKLLVVEDPLGEHGPAPTEAKDRRRFPAQESPDVCAKRLEIYRWVTGTTAADFAAEAAAIAGGAAVVEIMEVPFRPEHHGLPWHPEVKSRDTSVAYAPGQGRSRWMQVEDEISLPWVEARRVADELLEQLALGVDDVVGIVGLGTGAHVAFALAEAMMKRRRLLPVRLFTVCPPTVWPFEDAPTLGALVNTPIRYLTCPQSVAGPPWRLETATCGAFSHSHFEDKSTMLKLVMEEMTTLCSD